MCASVDGVGKIAENYCGTIGCTRTIYGDSTYIALFVDFLGLFASFSATYWLFIVVTTLVTLDVFNHFPLFFAESSNKKNLPKNGWVFRSSFQNLQVPRLLHRSGGL